MHKQIFVNPPVADPDSHVRELVHMVGAPA
jgi:hypothetical protein